MPDDKKKTLYNNLVKEGYDLPDYNTFVSDMTDETKRTKFHSSLVSEGYDIPDYKTFSVDMGFDSQKKNQIVNEGQPSGNIGSLASSRSGLQSNITNRQPVVVEQQAVPQQIDGIPQYDFTGKSGVATPQTSTQYDVGISELKSDKEKAQALRDLKVNKNINNQIIDVENQLQQEQNGFIQTPGLAQGLDLSIAGKNVLGTPTERKLEALKQEKQKIIDNYGTGEYLYDKLVSGMSNLWKSVVETPAFVYNLAAVPQNIIANYTGIPIGTSADEFGKMMGIENNVVADYYGNIINEVKQKSQEKFNTSIEQSIKDGRFTDALTQLGGSILESAPITMSIMAGNASGLTTAESIFGFGTMFAANNYAELNANPATANLPESVKMSNAIVNGLFEGIFEQFGVTKLGSIVKGMIKGKAKEEAVKISKDAFKQVYGKLFARYFGIAGEEALTEGMTQFSQNVSDKYYGIDPERDIFDGVVDAMIIGGFAGGIYTTPLMGNELYVTKKIREESKKTNIEKKALEQDLISDNIPIQEKAVISQRIQDINEIEAQRYDEAKNIVKDLTDEQKKEVGLMLNEIQQVEKTIENPNISDATKESLQQKVDEKQKQIDKLISEVEQRLSQPIKEEVKDDSKDITGVSGEVGVGEKPVETKPVAETGEEKISNDRMVQKEATPELDVTIEKISKAAEGKDISPDIIEEAAALVQEGLADEQDVFDAIEKAKSEPELKAELDNIEAEVGSDIPQSEVKQTEPPTTEKLPIGGSKKIEQPTGQVEAQKPAEQAPVEVKQETKDETKQEATAEIGTPKYKSGEGQLVGKKKNKTIANGEKIEGQYKIVSADDIVASHNEVTFSQSDNFPKNKEGKTINDRDYQQDSNAQKQVILIADKLDDRALHQTPIVSKDGIVLDGNNRTMSRKLAAKNGTDSDYIKALKENADMYGIENIDAIDNIKNPMLVFEASNDMPYDTKTYSKFNVTEKKEKSPIEKAVEISKTITDSGKRKLFKIFEQSKGTFSEITSKTSNIKDIVNMFLSEGLLQQNELPRYFDTERLTATSSGIELLRSTLLGSAINENTIRALDADNMGDIRNKILSSIVDLVKNNSLKENSLSSNIEKGIEIVNRAKKAGLTLEDWASQIDMFDQLKFDAIDLAVAIKLEGRFTEFIRRYNEDVGKTEFDFETGKPTIRTKENIIDDILIKEINNYEKVKRNIKELGQQGEGKADKNIKNDKQQGGGEKQDNKDLGAKSKNAYNASMEPIPSTKSKPKTFSQMSSEFSKALGKPIRYISKLQRRAAGTYSPSTGLVKIKRANNIPVMIHEATHYLDDYYGLFKKAGNIYDAELSKYWDRGSKPPKGHPDPLAYKRNEGFAEFMVDYLMRPKQTQQDAPMLYDLYNNTFNAKHKKALEQLGIDIRTFGTASPIERIGANIKKIDIKKNPFANTIKFAKELLNKEKFTYNFLNPFRPVEKAFKTLVDINQLPKQYGRKNFDALLKQFLGVDETFYKGITKYGMKDGMMNTVKDKNGNKYTLDSLLETINTDTKTGKKITSEELVEKQEYAEQVQVARRVIERENNMRREKMIEDILSSSNILPSDALLNANPDIAQKYDAEINAKKLNGAKVFPDTRYDFSNKIISGTGGGFFKDLADAELAVKEFDLLKNTNPELYKQINDFTERLKEMHNIAIDYMVSKELLSPEQAQIIRDNNVEYISFKRIREGEAGHEMPEFMTGGKPISNVRDVIKKLEGSSQQIENPVISFLQTWHSILKEGQKNEMMRSITDLADNLRSMYDGAPSIISDIMFEVPQGTKDAIKVMKNGKATYYKFNADITEALNDIGKTGVQLPALLTFIPSLLRQSVTTAPQFLFRNVIRDVSERAFGSTEGKFIRPKNLRKSKEEYLSAGGGQFGFFAKDRTDYENILKGAIKEVAKDKKNLFLKSAFYVPSKLGKAYSYMRENSEMIARIVEYNSVYEKMKEMGLSDYDAKLEAMAAGRRLLDFKVAGKHAKVINQLIPFFNPMIQGTRRAVDRVSKSPLKVAGRMIVYGGLLEFAQAAIIAGADDDKKKEYFGFAPFRKNLFYNIPIGDEWIIIPKGFIFGMLSSNIGRALDYAWLGDKNAFDSDNITSQLKTLNPINPQVFTGQQNLISSIQNNYDAFRERPIIPYYEKDKAIELREGKKNASPIGKLISNMFGENIDPRTIDYAVKSQFSYWGDAAIRLSQIGSKKQDMLPITGFLKGQSVFSDKNVNWVMKKAREYELTSLSDYKELESLVSRYNMSKSKEERKELHSQIINHAVDVRNRWKDADLLNIKEGRKEKTGRSNKGSSTSRPEKTEREQK